MSVAASKEIIGQRQDMKLHVLLACRMPAPYADLPDSSYTTRQRRPPLAGGLRCRPVTGS